MVLGDGLGGLPRRLHSVFTHDIRQYSQSCESSPLPEATLYLFSLPAAMWQEIACCVVASYTLGYCRVFPYTYVIVRCGTVRIANEKGVTICFVVQHIIYYFPQFTKCVSEFAPKTYLWWCFWDVFGNSTFVRSGWLTHNICVAGLVEGLCLGSRRGGLIRALAHEFGNWGPNHFWKHETCWRIWGPHFLFPHFWLMMCAVCRSQVGAHSIRTCA